MKAFFGLAIVVFSVHLSAPTCTFPSTFQNTWTTNTRGTWTVSSSTISNFQAQVEVAGPALFSMDCLEQYNGYYVLKSQETFKPFSTTDYNVYACILLEQQSDYKYIYALLTKSVTVVVGVAERVTIGDASVNLTGSTVCSDTAYTTEGERVHVALLNGSESDGKSTCPSALQGYLTYTGTTCNSTAVDVCTNTTQMVFNTTECTENTIFSQNGTLGCVYHNTIGYYTYVIVYNEDTSTDQSTYYQFSCMVISESGVYTYASVKPTECEANQVSITAPTGGYVTVFTQSTACSTSTTSEEDLTYLYVIIGILAFLMLIGLIALILFIICLIKTRHRKKDIESGDAESDKGSEEDKKSQKEDEEKPDKDGSEPEEETKKLKTDEDKQSVDSGFIPDKEESQQNKENENKGEDDENGENEDANKDEEQFDTNASQEEAGQEQVQLSRHESESDSESYEKDDEDTAPDSETRNDDEVMETEADFKFPQDQSMETTADAKSPLEHGELETEQDSSTELRKEGDEVGSKSSQEQTDDTGEEVDGQKSGSDAEEDTDDEEMDEEQRRIKKTEEEKGEKYIVREGQLSKVLVTRAMQEKARDKASKSRGVRLFASKKSKKQSVSDNPENAEDEMFDADIEDVDMGRFAQPTAPFMAQYQTKKDLEKKLDESHYWDLPEEENIVMQLDQIDEELEREEQKEKEKLDVTDVEMAEVSKSLETSKANVEIEKRAGSRTSSRSRDDSPESKKVRKDESDGDADSDVFDDDHLPKGFTRNENGEIVRMSDGKIYPSEYFSTKKAKLKKLFNIPRLKRNKKGRPIGGLKDDNYGPGKQEEELQEHKDNETNEKEEGRLSVKTQKSSDERKRTNESRRRSKIVAFSVGDEQYDKDGFLVEKEEKPRIDSSTVHRRKLRSRLFRKKKKRSIEDLPPIVNGHGGQGQYYTVQGTESEIPRELNSSLKVIGQPGTISSIAPRSTLPPIGMTRSDSAFDRTQIQNFREGLAKDQQILNNTNTIGVTPLPPRQSIRQISVEELSGDEDSNDETRSGHVDLGSEDEFVLIGPNQNQNEPLFTRVRGHPQEDLARSLKSHHDQRHAIPWSILQYQPSRPNTNGQPMAKSLDAPKSADMLKRKEVDDKRLQELLEELYKDKKYFDHVINTTNPVDNSEINDRVLAEHGREFLLDRADFWEDRGPLPPRPPRTSLGMRLSRMQTMTDSDRVSMTSTATPTTMELPNQMPLRQEQTFS